jgi:hypothetical protein
MPDKRPGGPLPGQTGTQQKTPSGGKESKPVTPNKGFEKKKK